MKTEPLLGTVVLVCLMSSSAPAQFHSGSNGSYGPMNITSNTVLNLPPDGIFHCTTINVANGVTLRFNRNALNTPVYLLATGNVAVLGLIDVSGTAPAGPGLAGQSGPGGFDGGAAPNGPGAQGGDGLGPGGGRFAQGGGAFATRPTHSGYPDGNTYGNTLLMPLIGGSGGAGARCAGTTDYGGGGGGGAILIASDTRIDFGNNRASINAFGGGACHGGQGSGGAIHIVAPIVAGFGDTSPSYATFRTYGGNDGEHGGNGWIRVDTTNRFQYALTSAGGTFTLGKFMQVFPTNSSRLDIIQAAGTNIVEGFPGPVAVQLPLGAPTNQTVTIQARNFSGIVPITISVTPDIGPSTRYDVQIDMTGGNVAQTNVSVIISAGTTSKIYAWTR